MTTTTCSRLPEKVIVNIIRRAMHGHPRPAKAEFSGESQWHFCSSTVSTTTTRRPWTALAIRGSHGKAAYLSPQATWINGRRPVLLCPAFAERFGGAMSEPDATKTSLIVGGGHSRGAVPEHHRAAAAGRARCQPQVAHP